MDGGRGDSQSNLDEQLSYIDELPEASSNLQAQHQQQQGLNYGEDIVQVVYQSNLNGSLVGIESTLLPAQNSMHSNIDPETGTLSDADIASYQQQQQLVRSSSTLPPVAEELSGGGQMSLVPAEGQADLLNLSGEGQYVNFSSTMQATSSEHQYYAQPTDAIYSRVNKPPRSSGQVSGSSPIEVDQHNANSTYVSEHRSLAQSSSFGSAKHPIIDEEIKEEDETQLEQHQQQIDQSICAEVHREQPTDEQQYTTNESSFAGEGANEEESNVENRPPDVGSNEENLGHFLFKGQKQGVAESGSFRNNFRKKLGISVSTNENDLTAHRQKFLESQESGGQLDSNIETEDTFDSSQTLGSSSKFKRTHSVSFNVNSARGNRHSIDIRNLPSYLTVKRASIVDVAKGAMSSLIHSFGTGSSGGAGSVSSQKSRDNNNASSSSEDDEPIFEEAIAPTLSLGQRVALIKNNGSEFGTVGWIGQLPDVDDDWIVGVIFDNMIGNCDGAYNGVRYFYARENYAMFVPLGALTKTDNYIGRPETGTMLSRMSVSLKPGQLISIQRSSIRLQHCFLNAPHQRVGHDVRAVSNRLHCQCHNCGPCAHLTKQSRINAIPHFGAHHIGTAAHSKKNSLAHAAVEILTHHHHHFHEDEAHEEEDYQFGDNAAHACNFVRYSCCQQNGTQGHEFSSDCGLVRPELLDNLIHAPKAPHRRSRPRRRQAKHLASSQVNSCGLPGNQQASLSLEPQQKLAIESNQSTLLSGQTGTLISSTYTATTNGTMTTTTSTGDYRNTEDDNRSRGSNSDGNSLSRSHSRSSSSSSSSSSSGIHELGGPSATNGFGGPAYQNFVASGGGYRMPNSHHNTAAVVATTSTAANYSAYQQNLNFYSTIDSQVSFMDQQRYIHQRDSAAMIASQQSYLSDDSYYDEQNRRGFGSSIRRCFNCIIGRRDRGHNRGHHGARNKRRKKRKTSLKDRMIEYRRKQSTFVPSTLAKPQEDFASHGLIMPPPGSLIDEQQQSQPPNSSNNNNNNNNSDYSSHYSHSSGRSSRSSSPGNHHQGGAGAVMMQQQQQQHNITMEHNQAPNDQLELKSNHTPQLDYNDYTFNNRYGDLSDAKDNDDYDESKFTLRNSTDLGFCDTCLTANSSNDTLKSLVDKSINEEVAPVEPLLLENFGDDCNNVNCSEIYISPISSSSHVNQQQENHQQVEVSSATISLDGEYEANDDNDDYNNQIIDSINRLSLKDRHEGDDS